MKKLDNFIQEVYNRGSIKVIISPLKLEDWDDLFKRFADMEIKGELVYYCSRTMLDQTLELLDEINAFATAETGYGEFHRRDNSWSFMVEATFMRGSYTVHLVCKQMSGGLLVPTLPEEEWGTDKLAYSSIKIDTWD